MIWASCNIDMGPQQTLTVQSATKALSASGSILCRNTFRDTARCQEKPSQSKPTMEAKTYATAGLWSKAIDNAFQLQIATIITTT
jgi:hypothetical protein